MYCCASSTPLLALTDTLVAVGCAYHIICTCEYSCSILLCYKQSVCWQRGNGTTVETGTVEGEGTKWTKSSLISLRCNLQLAIRNLYVVSLRIRLGVVLFL